MTATSSHRDLFMSPSPAVTIRSALHGALSPPVVSNTGSVRKVVSRERHRQPGGPCGSPRQTSEERAQKTRRETVRLLGLHHEVRAAILRPALLAVLGAHRSLFTVRDDRDARRPHAVRGEVVLGGLRAALAERDVVGVGAALVAVALDQH